MRTLTSLAAGAAVAATLVAAPAGAAGTAAVSLKNVQFNPKSVRITRGARVRFTWNDGTTPHNVTSRGARRFKSSSTRTAGRYVVRFTRSGTYRYVCTIHPGMSGKVIVR